MSCTVEFPVELGQTVWFVDKWRFKEPVKVTVEKLIFKQGGLYMQLSCNSCYETTCRSIGKTVFLSQEEAEKYLK